MKRINIRESLLKMDRETDCRYDLTSLYEAVRLDDEKKSKLVKYIDAYDIDATNKLLSNEAEAEGLMENTSDDISDEELSKVVGEAFVHMTDDTTYNPLVTTQSLKVGESVYDEATGNKWTVVNKVENGRWQCEVTFRDETTQEEFVRYAGNNALWELAVEGDTTYEVDDDIELEFHPIDELTANMHEAVPAAVMALGAAAATGFGQSLGDKVGSKLLGEDIDFDGEALKKQLLNATHEFLVNRYGYDDDFVNDYIHIEVSEADNDCYKVQVRTELSYEESSELADVLNPFVEALDPNAYFDHLNSNIIEAYIRKDQSDDIVDEAVVAEWKTIVDNCNTVDEIRDNYRKLVDVRDNGEMTYGTISAIGDLFMTRMDEIEGVNESLHEDGPEAYTMVKPNVKYKNFIGDTEVSYTDYNDAKAHFSDDYKIETYKDELQQFLNDNGEHFTVDVTTDGRLLIDISWGDWKHDHLRVDFLVSDFFNNKGLFVNSEKVTTEEDGSDTYSAEHYYTLSDFMFSQKPIEEAVEPTKDDETPYTKEQIEADLKSLTNNFTVEGDTLKCGFIEEAQYSEEILSQHYASVEIDKVGSWFQVDFKDPFNKGDSARGKKLRARGGFYGMPESVNEDWQKGDPVTLWWKDPDWHPTAPCYASCEYVGKTKDGKHKFVSDTYGWTYLLDIANRKVITPKGKEFEVHNDSGWLDRHLNEALNDYRFEVSCNDGPSKVIRTVATNEESAIKYVKNYYAQEHTTYADDRANKWTIRNLDESVEDSITRFKMEYYIDDGEKLVDYIYADNKEVAEKQLKDKVGECTITAMIPETVPAQYKKWDMNESKSIKESTYDEGQTRLNEDDKTYQVRPRKDPFYSMFTGTYDECEKYIDEHSDEDLIIDRPLTDRMMPSWMRVYESKSIKEGFSGITALADDCGKNTFKVSSRDIRFTFENEDDKTKFVNELLSSNIPHNELAFGVVSINKSAALDECKSIKTSFPIKEGRMTDRYKAQVKKHFEDEIDSTDISHEIAEDGLSFTIVREDGTKLEFNAAEGYTTTKPIKESTETRTVGIYGDEVNGMSSVDEIVSYLKKKGLTVSDVEGDMEYGWEMNVTGNPRDLFFAITNTFGGYKSDSVDDFINRYAIDESVKTETIATNPKEGDGTEWFVGDNDGGRIYYSESDAKKAYNFLVKRGVKDAVMELITDEE